MRHLIESQGGWNISYPIHYMDMMMSFSISFLLTYYMVDVNCVNKSGMARTKDFQRKSAQKRNKSLGLFSQTTAGFIIHPSIHPSIHLEKIPLLSPGMRPKLDPGLPVQLQKGDTASWTTSCRTVSVVLAPNTLTEKANGGWNLWMKLAFGSVSKPMSDWDRFSSLERHLRR